MLWVIEWRRTRHPWSAARAHLTSAEPDSMTSVWEESVSVAAHFPGRSLGRARAFSRVMLRIRFVGALRGLSGEAFGVFLKACSGSLVLGFASFRPSLAASLTLGPLPLWDSPFLVSIPCRWFSFSFSRSTTLMPFGFVGELIQLAGRAGEDLCIQLAMPRCFFADRRLGSSMMV